MCRSLCHELIAMISQCEQTDTLKIELNQGNQQRALLHTGAHCGNLQVVLWQKRK